MLSRNIRPNVKSTLLNFRQLRNLFIRTEETPNEHSLIFKPDKQLVTGENKIIEFTNANEARKASPLADELFRIEGVEGVMFGKDFISVNKEPQYDWLHLKPAIFASLMDYFTTGKAILNESKSTAEQDMNNNDEMPEFDPKDEEVVLMIKEILDSRVRPTVQGDGGDVQFVSYHDGIVALKLRGACRSCSSSIITLKHGIENMLMHYIPEVKEVQQVEDASEKASKEYFEKIEGQQRNQDDK